MHALTPPPSRVVGRHLLGYGAAFGAVALVSVFIGLVLRSVNLANVSMLYLLAVLATAVAFGRGPAVFASVAAFLTFDWFFVEPVHEWSVANPEEWVSLLFFLLTAIITGQLAADQRRRAHEARQREREAVVLYDVVRLVGEPDLEDALAAVSERLREELALAAGAIELNQPGGGALRIAAGDDDVLKVLQADTLAPADVLSAGRAPGRQKRGAPGRWIRLVPSERRVGSSGALPHERLHKVPLRTDDRRVGSLLLVSRAGATPFDNAARSALISRGRAVGTRN